MVNLDLEFEPPAKIKCAFRGCGKEFVPNRKWQKFCQDKCRYAEWTAQHSLQQLEGRIAALELIIAKEKEKKHGRGDEGSIRTGAGGVGHEA